MIPCFFFPRQISPRGLDPKYIDPVPVTQKVIEGGILLVFWIENQIRGSTFNFFLGVEMGKP